MSNVKCRFKVDEVKTRTTADGTKQTDVSFSPVFSDNDECENLKLWGGAPNGFFGLSVMNSSLDHIEADKEYLIDLVEVSKLAVIEEPECDSCADESVAEENAA